MSEKEKLIGEAPLKGGPNSGLKFILGENVVKAKHISDKAVTPAKVSDDFKGAVILPAMSMWDEKYQNITNELYTMVRSLKPNGVALSNQLGDREDIGVTQKTLSKIFGAIFSEFSKLTGETYMKFTLTVNPTMIYAGSDISYVDITADCSESISNFDLVQVYINDELVAESENIYVYNITQGITSTSEIKVVGTILGKVITKTATVTKAIPFFIGGGSEYTDVINEECRQELVGTLEGSYDFTVNNTGNYIFIIIPLSKKDEFRRITMNSGTDINGIEIPLESPVELEEFVVYKSVNTYIAGDYNIDININS